MARFAFCDDSPALSPVYRTSIEGVESFTILQPANSQRTAEIAFKAVVTNTWLPGLVPLFVVERKGIIELRRLPAKGQENISEPIFFALPPADEPEAALIAGRWKCEALRGDGSKAYPDFEIANDQSRISGRFDQSTEYRFAFIRGGTFLKNAFQLDVENVADKYVMSARFDNDELRGEWRHVGGEEKGAWKAVRDHPGFETPKSAALVELWEWQDANSKRRYSAGDGGAGAGWKRAPRPVCRVWKN